MRSPAERRRILLLTTSLAQGGAETVVAQLAAGLRSANCSVTVVSMLEPTAFVYELENAGVLVVSLGMTRNRPNLAGLALFWSYVRRFRPHLIHAHMYHASILARLASLLLRIPAICTVHSEVECSHKNTSGRFRELIYRVTDAAATCTTAVSERVCRRYVENRIVPANRIRVINNGVDLERFRPNTEARDRARASLLWQNNFVWLAVGRLELAKDYPSLMEAFRDVYRRFPSASLAIVGEGQLRSTVDQLIDRYELNSAVRLLGARSDVAELMNACDAFVMPSAWEGGPLVLLEAAACGRPMIATRVGVAPEVVVSGENGFLVASGTPAELADGMMRLMELGPNRLDEMGRLSRQKVAAQFSLRAMHDRYVRLYDEILTC